MMVVAADEARLATDDNICVELLGKACNVAHGLLTKDVGSLEVERENTQVRWRVVRIPI